MALISANQVKAARVSLGLSHAEFGRRAGIATNSVISVERGGDCRLSTISALIECAEAEGIVFLADGTVVARMVWGGQGRPASREVRDACLAIVNADRFSRNQCPMRDFEDT